MERHVNFTALIRCVKTRNKDEYTVLATLYYDDTGVSCSPKKHCFKVVCNDLKDGESQMIDQIKKFIDNHPYTNGVTMCSLVVKSKPYRNTRIVDQVLTYNLISRKSA